MGDERTRTGAARAFVKHALRVKCMSEMKVTFLGTSSARPTLHRNTSAILISYGPDSVLFDCGEGTQVRIMQSNARPSKLKAICLSHFHGDHVNGLPGLLGTMGLNGRTEPLTLVGPSGLSRWLKTLRELGILTPGFRLQLVDHDEEEVLREDGWRVKSIPLIHRIPTMGFRFDEDDLLGRFDVLRAKELGVPNGPLFGHLQRGEDVTLDDGRVVRADQVVGPPRRGRRVAIITDTRPCAAVIDFAKGADLLIHEATYGNEEARQAHERFHSTAAQAAEIAKKAKVKQLVLTHFSSKYARVQPLLAQAREIFPATRAAKDLDEVILPVPE